MILRCSKVNQKAYISILKYGIALVWLINGVYCKVLDQVPRHRQIVGEILGETYARELTVLIGISEIIMAIWVISGWQVKLNVRLQILVVGLMNVLEFILVRDLLLWGEYNIIFAGLFIFIVYYYGFVLRNSRV